MLLDNKSYNFYLQLCRLTPSIAMQMSLIGVMILPNMFRLTDQTSEELFLYLQVSISHRMKLKEWFIITFFSLRSEC